MTQWKRITVRYAGQKCIECGGILEVGDRATKIGKGKLMCDPCQMFDDDRDFDDDEPLGLTLSRIDPYGVYTPDGRKLGSTCGCEDYPCCGH